MISLLFKWICKSPDQNESALRGAYGKLCGAVGIALNILLFAGKFFAGLISGSIAITADAFNNLSDAGSSVVTLLGFRLAEQKPDPRHPFGHGRFEYLSGLAVAMLILLMGVELAKESVSKILHPAPVEGGALVLGILAASVAVKLYMASYNRTYGRRFNAPALLATAADSLSDCVATSAVLLATLAGQLLNVRIDGWVGALVALFILRAGLAAAKETIDPLLGLPPDPEFVGEIAALVKAHPLVCGIHDLVVHDYGPGRVMISLHAEVPASENVLRLHDEIDNIERELQEKLGCAAVIHMDPVEADDEATALLRRQTAELVRQIDPALTIHDFRIVPGPTHTNLIFDAVAPQAFRMGDQELEEAIHSAVRAMEGSFFAVVTVEHSYT